MLTSSSSANHLRRRGRAASLALPVEPKRITDEEAEFINCVFAGGIEILPRLKRLSPSFAPLADSLLSTVEVRRAYVYDSKGNVMVGGGDELAALYGYSAAEIHALPQGWLSIIHPDDRQKVELVSEETRSGVTDFTSVQMRISCKDGRWEWIQHDGKVLKRDEKGGVEREAGVVQVITELALAMQAICNESALNALSRMLIEEWVECIFLLDLNFRFLYVNQGGLDGICYTQPELHGRALDTVFRFGTARRRLRQLPKNNQKVTLRGELVRKDGSAFAVEATARRLAGDRVLVTARDITAQQAAEDAERRQTAYYKALFVNNPSGVAVFDSSLQIRQANPALRRMVGYTDRQLAQMALGDLLDARSRGELENWSIPTPDSGRTSTSADVMLRRRDGRVLYAHAAVTVMAANAEAGFRGIIILTDISARRQAEQELARQSALNDTLVRESAAMISMVDLAGRILKVNPAVERVSGYASKELEGKLMWDSGLLDEEEIPQARRQLAELAAGAPRVTALSRTRTKAGDLRILQVQNTATRGESGTIDGYIVTAVDLTEQHRLQHHLMEAVEKEQARIGHDLHDGVGQLLTGIGAMTEALQARLGPGVERQEAERIHTLVKEAIQQVRQLSHSMSPAAIQHRDLHGALILLADSVRSNFRRRCECQLDPDIRVRDGSTASHLFRIAQESLNNAIRHGNPTHIKIKLSDQDGTHAVLEIENDGGSFDCRPGSDFEGIGLRVMNYRASLIGAELSVTCPAEGVVRVACRFPFASRDKLPRTKTTDKHRET